MKLCAIVIGCTFLIACGGSSGATTDPPTPPNPNPKPIPDEPGLGYPVVQNGLFFSMNVDGTVYEATASGQTGNVYAFDPTSVVGGRIYPTAMSNDDALIFAFVLDPNNSPENSFPLGIDGDFFTATPSMPTVRYEGDYTSFDRNGNNLGIWNMEVYINFDNIIQSYGINPSVDEVTINFSEYHPESNTIIGTISDPNHDYALASFSLFGPDGRTLAGGYADENGIGILLVESE